MRVFAALLLILTQASAQESTDPTASLEEARADERNVLDQINTVDKQLSEIAAEANDLQQRISDYEASRLRHQDDVASANAMLERRRDDVSTRVGALYKLQRRGLARFIFGAEDASELRRRMRYMRSLVEGDAGPLGGISREPRPPTAGDGRDGAGPRVAHRASG